MRKTTGSKHDEDGLSLYHLERSVSDQFDIVRLPEYSGFPQKALGSLKKLIEKKVCLNIDALSQDLAMTPRTLDRRLKKEGVSFEHMLNEVRRYYSLHLIVQDGVSIADISSSLGFLDEEEFNFYFCLWTGLSARNFQSLYDRAIRN